MNRIRKLHTARLQAATNFMFKFELEVDGLTIDIENKNFLVNGRDGISSTFGFHDQSYMYMELTAFDDIGFMIEVIPFLETIDWILDTANMFSNVDSITGDESEGVLTLLEPLNEHIEFITLYQASGFPMWFGLDHLKNLLFQARALNHDEVLQ